jgi:hypothetical protein
VRTESFAKDPRQTALIAAYEQLARPLAQRVVGRHRRARCRRPPRPTAKARSAR